MAASAVTAPLWPLRTLGAGQTAPGDSGIEYRRMMPSAPAVAIVLPLPTQAIAFTSAGDTVWASSSPLAAAEMRRPRSAEATASIDPSPQNAIARGALVEAAIACERLPVPASKISIGDPSVATAIR